MRALTLTTFFLILSGFLFSQDATIRGFVYEKDTGEPVIFTNVYLQGTTIGAATDVNGFYQITKVPPGTYTLIVTYLGYDTLRENITVAAGEIMTKKLFLTQSAINIRTVTISAEKQDAQNQVKISVEKITPKEIQSLPSQGGEADLAQYLQVLPGVVFTGDQGGQLYIRGGSPVQNKVLLDGMIVYNPFHSIGLFSVFDTDILRNADVYSGGFNAEYGGRISSVMDITTRDGNKQRIAGKVSASTFGAKALIEGPLKSPSEPGGASSSFVLSAKRSYLDKTSKSLYSWINDGEGLPFIYQDLYGKLSFNGSNGSKVNFFGFNFQDEVFYQGVSDLNWNTYGVGANFVLIPGNTPTLIEGNFAFSDYEIQLSDVTLPPRSSGVNGFNMGLNFKYFSGDNEFKYGFEVLGFQTNFKFSNAIGLETTQEENTTEVAGYFSYKLKAKRLVFEPSIRGHYYASLAEFSFEPRVGAKYNITDQIRLKAAAGLYSQNLIAANSDRDVVNFFYGFLSGPEDLQESFVTEEGDVVDRKHRLQKSIHYVAGIEYDITRNLEVNLEGYIKDFTQLINTNRNKIFEDDINNTDVPDELKKNYIIETGLAQGVDLVLKYKERDFDIWAVYSLQKSDRWDGIRSYAPVFDRRHNVNLIGTYRFGKENSWETNIRWNFGSELPFTPNRGFAQQLSFGGEIDGDYYNENPDEVFNILGDLNSKRLTPYHRLDLNLKKLIDINEHQQVEVNLGVTNIYNRENIFYIARDSFEFVYQLPILPSLGISWTF
ncbi:MAG: TonB-dependent receptor [Flavobacteriales bacterium]|nr:TonB-dependent receptor [Flavobacteriales bacterium]